MIKLWFLLILMSIQDGHPLVYRGFMGYESEAKCLEKAILAENFMVEIESRKGNGNKTIWIKSHCIPFDIFPPKAVPSTNGNGAGFEA